LATARVSAAGSRSDRLRALPIIVSFYGGQPLYHAAAEQLRHDCVALELDHDIVELPIRADETWLAICRRKVAFYLEMQRKHRRPIFWLDVDSRLRTFPSVLDGATCDMAAFLRGFRYLRDFDPVAMPRFFAPFALYFNYAPSATAFLELLENLADELPDDTSDDFILQEAWLRHQQQLSVMVLPPNLVGHEWPLRENQAIYVGISGHVSQFKGKAKQHTADLFEAGRRKAVLMKEAEAAQKSGRDDDALVLFKQALAAVSDDELAAKIGRLIKRRHGSEEAERFLSEHGDRSIDR
jgi:hypothetical protein